jgi:hypothetical protein
MTAAMADEIDKEVYTLMEWQLGEVNEALAQNKPEVALAQLTSFLSFLNAGARRLPAIIRKLERWVNKITSTANALAKKLGADGFSISVAVPFGVSIDLSFPTK